MLMHRCYKGIYITGAVISKGFFPVFVPIGVVGNILSFLVRNITVMHDYVNVKN